MKKNRKKRIPFRQPIRQSNAKLSLCMIVKNEAQNLGPCIIPLKPVLDEIIVVDTGSTDETKEIASQLGAKIFDFPWCDDFSAARNESIRHATGDYILWLDADDRLDGSEVEKIRQLKKMFPTQKNQAYYLVINSQSPVDGETLYHQMRIFPNVRGALFEGRVHEQIFYNLGRRGIRFVKTDFMIRHTGYPDPSVVIAKSERNLRILEKELESDPDNPLLHCNAARTLAGIGRTTEAVAHIRRVTGDERVRKNEKDLFLDAALLLGKYCFDLGRYDEAVSAYREVLEDKQRSGLAHFCLGQVLSQKEDYRGAREALEKSMHFPVEVGLFPVNIDGYRYYQYYTLGQCYLETGETGRAREMFQKSLNLHRDHYKSMEALALLALRDQQFEGAIRYYEKAIREGGVSDQNYANLGLAYRKLNRSTEAEEALTRALAINSNRVEALTNLGYLYYYQKKEYPKAIDCFTRALDLAPDMADARLALSDIYFRLYELEKLVHECEALRKGLGLACDMTLNSFEEVSALYEEMGRTFSDQGRIELSLMAYWVAFLIYPTNLVLKRIFRIGESSNMLNSYVPDIKEILKFHNILNQGLAIEKVAPGHSEQNI